MTDTPTLPEAETPEETQARLSAAQVAAEVRAIDALVTLPQPVPVHVDNPAGEIPFTSELQWFCATEVIGTGQAHPGDCGGGGVAPTLTAINPNPVDAWGAVDPWTIPVTFTGTGLANVAVILINDNWQIPAAAFTTHTDTTIATDYPPIPRGAYPAVAIVDGSTQSAPITWTINTDPPGPVA